MNIIKYMFVCNNEKIFIYHSHDEYPKNAVACQCQWKYLLILNSFFSHLLCVFGHGKFATRYTQFYFNINIKATEMEKNTTHWGSDTQNCWRKKATRITYHQLPAKSDGRTQFCKCTQTMWKTTKNNTHKLSNEFV